MPPKCVYAMLMCGSSEKSGNYHCGYILITGHMRGCDPGMNCTRYLRGKRLPQTALTVKRKKKPFTWDVEEGKRMLQQGK